MPIHERKEDDGQRETPPRKITSTSRRNLLHLLGAGAAAGLAGCSGDTGQSTGTETQTRTTTNTQTERKLQRSAVIGIPRNVTEDWQTVYGVTPYWVRVLEPLTWSTPNLKPAPWLAKDWKQIDETTWEFYLRENVTFHNGDPLNADAVIFSLKKLLTEMSFAELLQTILQMKPEGLKKVNDMTVEMNTTSPNPLMPERLTHLIFSIQHPQSSKDQKWGNVIGTGPYEEKELKPDDRLTVSAYDEYWKGPPKMEELTYRFIADHNTRALALTGRQIDIGMDLSPSQFKTLKNAKETEAVAQTQPRSGTFHFNNTNPPIDDIKLRKALNFAVSQKKIVDGGLDGIGSPARGIIPPNLWASAHNSLPTYGPDKAKAKKLVEESAYNGETLKVISNSESSRLANPELVAQIFQQQAKDIGINIKLQMLSSSAFSDAEDSGSGHIYQKSAFTGHAAIINMFEVYDRRTKLGPPWKFNEKTEEKLSTLLKKARTAKDRKTAKNAFREIEKLLLVQEAILIPLYYQKYIVGVKNDVAEFDWHPIRLNNRMEKFKLYK